ncbi:hypothetical protein HDA32_004732 [Spinactinospora alkalitolerans]|uniref:DNA primase n=1 Tax=Spinactinospora alkalitolerans TaxID=687207 RepID=A0A852U2G8_9ACTN|nr:YfjI family protein [Spinactinospora alkalitolerans]NYE49612.1 hypothetical protein [Spinactinospora alkalitolerans]
MSGTEVHDQDPAEPWEPPVPLGAARTLPAFPVDALPDWVAAMVTGVAEETQTPADMAGCLALAALSTAAGGRAIVQVRGNWSEPVNIFTVVAMPPASRKSAVFRAMTAPLMRAEKQLVERVQPQIIEAQLARDVATGAAEKAKRLATGSGPDGDPTLMADASDAAMAVEAIQVPPLPRLMADDITPEAAASLLAEQGGRLAVLSAEGGIFATLAGRYSGVPNFEVFLKGHAGDMLRVDRKGAPAEHVEHPALTLGLAVQPEVISEIATGPGFRGKGLLGRFLYSLPASNVGYRRIDPDPVPEDVAAVYDTQLQTLVHALADWDDPIRLQVHPDALSALQSHAEVLETRLRPDSGDLNHIGDWAGKYIGAVARLAALIHLGAHPSNGWRIPVDADTMAAAIRLGEYFTAHALATFDHMGADPDLAAARTLMAWIERKRPERFTARDAFRTLPRGTFRKAADLAPALETLEGYGWIRQEPAPPPSRKGGRPPSPAYQVHPDISGPGA